MTGPVQNGHQPSSHGTASKRGVEIMAKSETHPDIETVSFFLKSEPDT